MLKCVDKFFIFFKRFIGVWGILLLDYETVSTKEWVALLAATQLRTLKTIINGYVLSINRGWRGCSDVIFKLNQELRCFNYRDVLCNYQVADVYLSVVDKTKCPNISSLLKIKGKSHKGLI